MTREPSGSSVTHEFSALYREYAQLVYRTAYGVTGSHEEAEDILQTLFLRLIRHEILPDLQKNPRAYLYRAAVNLSLDAIRSARRHTFVEDSVLQQFPAPVHEDPDALDAHHRRLYEAIAQLKPRAAEILILRYVHGKSDAEIAGMLGVSRGTIALRLFRTRARLKKLLWARVGDR
jgi:RNA polymerase sigma-70 factor (ECF subfamily)